MKRIEEIRFLEQIRGSGAILYLKREGENEISNQVHGIFNLALGSPQSMLHSCVSMTGRRNHQWRESRGSSGCVFADGMGERAASSASGMVVRQHNRQEHRPRQHWSSMGRNRAAVGQHGPSEKGAGEARCFYGCG